MKIQVIRVFLLLTVVNCLDSANLAATPTCGFEDKPTAYFNTNGGRWKSDTITYRVLTYPRDQSLSKSDVDLEIKKAFAMWEEVTPLRFVKSASRSADILINWKNIDGRSGTLAYAYSPGSRIGGDAFFDNAENWKLTRGNKHYSRREATQLLNTLTHEFGHSIGLSHSTDIKAIMYKNYQGWNSNLRLARDDINGIQSIYGPPQGRRPTPTVEPNRITTSKPKGGADPHTLCGSRIDAALQISDSVSYVFLGDSYRKLTGNTISLPRKISKDWPGLTDNIDAAVTLQKRRVSYFFKGNIFWKFKNRSPIKGYPKDISKWKGLPGNLDAAFSWGKDEHLYFFKGVKYWKYNTKTMRLESSYPKSISSWKGLPVGVEAALRWTKGRTYVFKSGKYFRLNDKTGAVDKTCSKKTR